MTETARGPSPGRVSLAHLVLLLPWVAVVVGSFKPVTDNSYLWHITAGRVQADSGSVLTADPFSFTMGGESWLTQSWLVELLYATAHQRFGLGFTGVMLLLLGSLFFVAVGLLAFRWSGSVPATAVTLLLTTVLMVPFLVPRPVIFSFLLMPLVILAWESKKLRWSLPFLLWLWASAHGSFAIGLAYIVLRWMALREWRAWPHLAATGLATLLTAHGIGVLTMLGDFLAARPHLALVSEWRTPDLVTPALAPFLLGILVMIYGAMRGRLALSWLWVIAPFLALGMSATRAVPPAWVALVPVMAAALHGARLRGGRGFPRTLAGSFTAGVILLPFLLTSPVSLDEERFPVEAADHLEDVRTFHDDSAGGYLIYEQGLSEGVFIDDRVELYRGRIDEFVALRTGRESWERVFERDRVEQVLLKVGEPMIGWLTAAGWHQVHGDDSYVVLLP